MSAVVRYLLPPEGEDYRKLEDYCRQGGYKSAARALKEMTPEAVIEEVKNSGLRGRGGAGFNAGQKWSFMPKPGNGSFNYLGCNFDESEPGTYKDRQIAERNPHILIEGLIIASYAIRAAIAYVFIRGEYVSAYRSLGAAIAEAREAGYLGSNVFGSGRAFDIHLHRGAGAYICGEETGLIESLEGKRAHPRKRPPFPAGAGFWGRPTTINNVETVSHVPAIIERGAEWFKSLGTPNSAGNTLYGVSGHVNRPGVYELPLGTPLRKIIFEHAGGVKNGRKLKAIIPGGVSMPVLSANQVDVCMDHDGLREAGSLLGTGAIIVMDDTTCMVRAAIVISRFFRHESCGQCTQCREGSAWLNKILCRIESGKGSSSDLKQIETICSYMEGQTICAFSDAAAWASGGMLRRFRSEFAAHVTERGCPLPESFEV